MNDPIWSDGVKVGLPIVTVIALALLGFAAFFVYDYFRDRTAYKNAVPRAEKRRERAEAFTTEMKTRVAAERATAAGGTVTEGNIDSWVSDYEIRNEYEDKFPGANYFGDFNGRISEEDPSDDRSAYFGPAAAFLAATLLVLGVTAMSMYPFSSVYHQWRVVQGPVTAVSGEKLDSTDGGSLWLSWVFDINGKKYLCDEPRCGTIDQGEIAKLRCKPNYQSVGSEVNACRFVSVKGA